MWELGIWKCKEEYQMCFINYGDIKQLSKSLGQSLSWEADDSSASEEVPTIYGTWWFLTVLTGAYYWSLSFTRLVHYIFN